MSSTQFPALYLAHRHTLGSGEPVTEVASLRRPELVLRYTRCHRLRVDERLLGRSFPTVKNSSRCVATVVVAGALALDGIGILGPGEGALTHVDHFERRRSQDLFHLDLEWAATPLPVGARRLTEVSVEVAAEVGDAIHDQTAPQRSTLTRAFDLFRSVGVPVPWTIDELEGEPSEQDRRLARAFTEHVENLSSPSSEALQMADLMGISERQLHRLFRPFCERYAINTSGWRDARNRWRVQHAVLLLSRPELTVATVAREVGYASPNALARALAQSGFPSPAEIRARMSDLDPLS